MGRKRSRFAAWRAEVADRLAHSSQLFLFGLVVACGVEVAVDWNQTLVEVNILRDQIRQKGMNYAGLLERAVVEPVLSNDRATLDRLATGLIDDEDAVYVRIVDARAQVIYDRIDEPFAKSYAKRGRGGFAQHYEHWLDRDLHGVIDDPEGFKERLGNSRYRDLPQIYNDLMKRAMAAFSTPPPLSPLRARTIYQDRLRDEHHRRDESMTWAIAPLLQDGPSGTRKVGAVLVAFDMTRINSAVRTKYIKGVGMILFFVALILLQNIIGRRDKLRLFDLGRRYAAAKQALHQAMPQQPVTLRTADGEIAIAGVVDQAKESVDGLVFDAIATAHSIELLVADPDGDGIDAAAIGLHVQRIFRKRWQPAAASPEATAPLDAASLFEDVALLGAATRDIPLTRPIGLLRLRVLPTGGYRALFGDTVFLLEWSATGLRRLPSNPLSEPLPAGIIGPLFQAEGQLAPTATLLGVVTGKGNSELRLDDTALSRWLRRLTPGTTDEHQLDELAAWLRSKAPALADNDLAVLALNRQG